LLLEGDPPQQVLEGVGGLDGVRDSVGHLRVPARRRRGQRSMVVQRRKGPTIGQVSSTKTVKLQKLSFILLGK